MFDLQDLENEDNFINNGRRNTLSISMWFLALEAFVNALCKVTGIIKNHKNIDEIIRKEISGRISFLIEELGYDSMKIKKTGIYGRVNEFRMFRNEIFHDRNSGEKIVFKKTLFSSTPNRSNQVDVFQSLQIFMEVASLFRHSIPGLDLMPNIALGNQSVLKFEKLDTVYSRFLAPFFLRVLIKRNLTTKLKLELTLYQLSSSTIFKIGEIVPIQKILQDQEYKIEKLKKTNLGEELYNLILESNESTIGMNFLTEEFSKLSK
ncbi:hypothetical protein NU08_0175 [Flavobacterium anhuiense]|uniref:Uncharacterized protein n=2 Tax=Flavobacterium anhuiense TaxID=459526 RepID=A0A444W4X0_9FLAO|nr:hypothetical protein NU08_0175 [Flavobacterium anhuiense]